MKIKQITKHGQEQMIFHCDSCGKDVGIDTFDVLNAEGDLHCPLCGADTVSLNEAQNENNEDFTARINDFIKSKKVIDIKYSTYADDDGYFYQNVLIMYEEN